MQAEFLHVLKTLYSPDIGLLLSKYGVLSQHRGDKEEIMRMWTGRTVMFDGLQSVLPKESIHCLSNQVHNNYSLAA